MDQTKNTVTIGSVIRLFREKRNMNQSSLADAADISKGLLSELESGGRTNLTIDTLSKIATAMSTRASVMLRKLEEGQKV